MSVFYVVISVAYMYVVISGYKCFISGHQCVISVCMAICGINFILGLTVLRTNGPSD